MEHFNKDSLGLNAAEEVERIVDRLCETVSQTMHRRGAVVGISGGIDSSVVLALCVRAFGAERVIGLLLPEKESDPKSAELAHVLAKQFGIETITEDITSVLDGFGCYRRRDTAIQRIFSEYRSNAGWKVRIVLPNDLLEHGSLNVFYLVVTDPQGKEYRQRLPLREFEEIVAGSNFKQRARTDMLYYHAEVRRYAVIGTPNKNEHDLGFFVKFGDGGYDLAPIRHLYKSQVYQLGNYLEIPQEISSQPATTDTYPGGGSQEEFFYRIPFEILDMIWLGYENKVDANEIAEVLGLTEGQVLRVQADIERKRRTTAYLRMAPLGLEQTEG